MKNPNVVPVLLNKNQIAGLRQLQARERQKSPLGITPTIHEIARSLMNKALHDAEIIS